MMHPWRSSPSRQQAAAVSQHAAWARGLGGSSDSSMLASTHMQGLVRAPQSQQQHQGNAQRLQLPRLGSVRSIQGFARIAETEKGMTKFTGFYPGGFYINNVQVPGSVLASHDMYMLWRPRSMADVTPESLVFLELIRPAPQVLVLGCGASATPLPGPVSEYLARQVDVKAALRCALCAVRFCRCTRGIVLCWTCTDATYIRWHGYGATGRFL